MLHQNLRTACASGVASNRKSVVAHPPVARNVTVSPAVAGRAGFGPAAPVQRRSVQMRSTATPTPPAPVKRLQAPGRDCAQVRTRHLPPACAAPRCPACSNAAPMQWQPICVANAITRSMALPLPRAPAVLDWRCAPAYIADHLLDLSVCLGKTSRVPIPLPRIWAGQCGVQVWRLLRARCRAHA